MAVQVLSLPTDGKGLAWVAQRCPGQLLLVPGLHATSITAAAAGHHQALQHVHAAALAFAAPGQQKVEAIDRFFSIFSATRGGHASDSLDGREIGNIFCRRDEHTCTVMRDAVRESELHALKWLLAICYLKDAHGSSYSLMCAAASAGRLNTLRYLHSLPWTSVMSSSISLDAHKHPACLRWLLEQGCPVHQDIIKDLAGAGDLDMLRCLWGNDKVPGDLWNSYATCAAASNGHKVVVQWLRSLVPPCSWDETCMAAAAANSDLSMMQWLQAQGAPWDRRTVFEAASNGSIPVLQWLRSQDSDVCWNLDELSMLAAVQCGNLSLLQWLRAQDPPAEWANEFDSGPICLTSRAAADGN